MKMHENRNNNMESFYEDNGQYVATTTQLRSPAMKRPISLNLDLATNNNKQAQKRQVRVNQPVVLPQSIINTPDVCMMKLGTPDVEKLIMDLPTPSLLNTTFNNPLGAAKEVTNEQEEYAQPFVDALNNLHNSEKAQQSEPKSVREFSSAGAIVTNPTIITTSAATSTILSKVGMSGGSVTYTNLDDSYPVTIKDEPQTVPNSPPMSPIDMASQEKIKLERKRQRNRVAASKCRKRKLERISKLEDKVKQLKGENIELSGVIKTLKEHVIHLKKSVIDHIKSGCSIPTAYFVQPTKNESDIK